MTKSLLRISPSLTLPDEVVTEVLAWLGRRGSGKTYGASKFAELLHARGAQFVVIDTVGVWYGLRLAANGTDKGLEIPVLGGLHGDIPLEPTAGALIADLVVDRQLSVVLDVSQWEADADKARFAADFGRRFFHRKRSNPSAVHVILEECQEIVPQNPQREEIQMLHVWTRTAKLGRNYGIGLSLLSQRPQEVNKKVLNLAEVLFAFQLAGTHERKAVEAWIESKDIDEDISGELPKLKTGAPHVWSPALLGISKVVSIDKKWTFDASRTPKLGEKAREVKPLAPIDLTKLQKEMSATIEKAKADDPAQLRKQLAEAQRALAAAAKGKPAVVADPNAVSRAVQKAIEERDRHWTKEFHRLRAEFDGLRTAAKRAVTMLQPIADAQPGVTVAMPPAPSKPAPLPLSSAARVPISKLDNPREVVRPEPKPQLQRAQRKALTNGTQIGGTPQRMLDAMAALEQVGIERPSRAMVAGWVGISSKTGTFRTYLSELRSAGYVSDGPHGAMELTSSGRAQAGDTPPFGTLAELHDIWLRKLGGTPGRMLSHLIEIYPEATTRDELAQAVGINASTGTFRTYLSELRSPGLIVEREKGSVAASDLLYPPGLT